MKVKKHCHCVEFRSQNTIFDQCYRNGVPQSFYKNSFSSWNEKWHHIILLMDKYFCVIRILSIMLVLMTQLYLSYWIYLMWVNVELIQYKNDTFELMNLNYTLWPIRWMLEYGKKIHSTDTKCENQYFPTVYYYNYLDDNIQIIIDFNLL